MKLGVLVALEEGPEGAFAKVESLGFPTCQVSCWEPSLLTPAMARRLSSAATAHDVAITTMWVGLPGHVVWNFVDGPQSIGLVPAALREERVAILKKGSDFADRVGVPSITTHVGFIPENMNDVNYGGVVRALKDVAAYCKHNAQSFWFETGQETPVTLLRTIEDIGAENVGVNLDPANLLMYGKANPVDALDVIGRYVRGVHAKDGEYPTDGRSLGVEKALGQGRVNFPALLAKLHALGYDGALTIEREISGPQQIDDIRLARSFLQHIIDSLG